MGRPAIDWKRTRGDFPTTGKPPLRPLAIAFAGLLAAGAAPALADAPRISDASITPARFAVDPLGPPEVQAGVARGTTFHYTLSKSADVFFFIDRGAKGRVVGGRCRRQGRRNRHHRRCAFYVRSGSFRQAGLAGPNSKSFSGRIGRLTLPPARYRATLVAVDDMGNPSKPGVRLRFTVLRGP